jgi:hypothetical protein
MMMFDILVFVLNILLPLALVVGWGIAEFRCRRAVRLSLGLACLLFSILWLWAAIDSSRTVSDMHRLALHQIERLIKEGREPQVHKAVMEYDSTYEKTQSAKAAVFHMNSVLAEGTFPAVFDPASIDNQSEEH